MPDIRIILPLISASLSVVLGLVVLFRNTKKTNNISFFIFSLTVALWVGGVGMFYLSQSTFWMDFWARLLYFAGGSIAVTFFYFSLIFLKKSEFHISLKRDISILAVSVIYFILYLFTDVILAGTFVTGTDKGFVYGPGRYLFELHIWSFFVLALIQFIRLYRTSNVIIRSQIKYILLGVYVSLGIANVTNIILLWWGYFRLIWVGASSALIWLALVTYAISRYRFLDIRVAIRKFVVMIILAAFVFFSFHLVNNALLLLFGAIDTPSAYLTGILIAAVFVLIYTFFANNVRRLVYRYVYGSAYNAEQALSTLAEQSTSVIELDKLVSLIVNTVLNTLQIVRAGVLLKKSEAANYAISKVIGFNRRNGISLVKDNYLTNWLQRNRKALVLEELAVQYRYAGANKERAKIKNLEDNMRRIEAALVLPLISQNKIFGLIVLGAKKSGDAYTNEDIKLLEDLGNQAAVALKNAQLYNQMRDIVEEQTADLRKKNIHLQKLLKMRGEFLDIASHQLRTPISVIKGYVSMLVEGDYEGVSADERQKVYRSVAHKTEKLRQIINDILYASELDTGEFALQTSDLELIEIMPYVAERLREHQEEAREKDVKLKLEDGVPETLRVRAAPRYLEVILDNLIGNAIVYTLPQGEVTVRLIVQTKPKSRAKRGATAVIVRVEVRDTGIGIPKESQRLLYQKFIRGGNANSMHTDGSGLGLFIVKKLAEAHPHGAVGFKSVLGKGSTFWVELAGSI